MRAAAHERGQRPFVGRPTCWTCRRALAACWCDRVRPFTTAARFVIVMHPKEAKVAIGTGRLAHHALAGSTLRIGERLDDDAALAALLDDPAHAPLLLFPRRDALDLTTAPREAVRALVPPGRRPLVVVPDGTWTTAKKLVRLSRRLDALPALCFTPAAPARYDRLRKEPRAGCRSTIEAVHAVIDELDAHGLAPAPQDRAHDHLLTLLDALVAFHTVDEPARRATRGPRLPPQGCR